MLNSGGDLRPRFRYQTHQQEVPSISSQQPKLSETFRFHGLECQMFHPFYAHRQGNNERQQCAVSYLMTAASAMSAEGRNLTSSHSGKDQTGNHLLVRRKTP